MTRTELNKMIQFHEARLARVMHLLNNHYYQMEETNNESYWVGELTKEKRTLEWLKAQKADDE